MKPMKRIPQFLVLFFAAFLLLLPASPSPASAAELSGALAAIQPQKPQSAAGSLQQTATGKGAQPLLDNGLVTVAAGVGGISGSEKAELEQKLAAINARYDVHAGAVYVDRLPAGHSAESLAKNLVNSNAYGDGSRGSIVLLVAVGTRDYYIATGRNLNKIIPSNKNGIGHIQNAILPSLKDNKFGQAGLKYADALEEELAYFQKEGKPFDPSAGFSILSGIIAAVLAALSGFGFRSYLVGQLSNVSHAESADEYLERDTFELTDEEDTYLYTNVTVVDHSKKSSGGGGGFSDDSGSTGGGGGKF
ncbi:MAG: TPM domain-containing protein [Schwartzia sp.]|nr:TPM domain-containing protein [Schwartzia sp. (in: firmicutes)]